MADALKMASFDSMWLLSESRIETRGAGSQLAVIPLFATLQAK